MQVTPWGWTDFLQTWTSQCPSNAEFQILHPTIANKKNLEDALRRRDMIKHGLLKFKRLFTLVSHWHLTTITAAQSCVDWNRDVLKRELGLEEEDIIDLPILFKLVEDSKDNLRALAYYPDMVRPAPPRCRLVVPDLWASCSPRVPSGQHDRFGEEPGHPQAFRAPGERTLRPGGWDAVSDGGPGSELHLHRQLQLLPQAARGGALRLQCPQEAVRLQVVEPRHVKRSSIRLPSCRGIIRVHLVLHLQQLIRVFKSIDANQAWHSWCGGMFVCLYCLNQTTIFKFGIVIFFQNCSKRNQTFEINLNAKESLKKKTGSELLSRLSST